MQNIEIKVKKLDERAKIPTYGTPFSAGADLYALLDEQILLQPHETVFVRTGLAVDIPEGYMGLVFARSGLSCKQGLAPANKVGVVDSDYRGEVMVALHNHSNTARTVAPGDRIAQFVVVPYLQGSFCEVENLSPSPSTRGEGGFGSTGSK